jgi:hypothetical protein
MVHRAIEAGVFHPNPGWHCKDCPVARAVLGVGSAAPERWPAVSPCST